jgi:uncharacterized protein (DUF1800 family)
MKLPTPQTLPAKDAWKPLPRSYWNAETASHFTRRIGYSATPGGVLKASKVPLKKAINDAFARNRPLEKTTNLAEFEAAHPQRLRDIYRLKDQESRRKANRDLRRENDHFFREYALQWFNFARQEANSPQEKFVTFLHDVFVIEQNKIREPQLLFNYEKTLREGIRLDYRELCKRISREPAMVRYLDLDESTAKNPNENFARELFELFILGEGNYTEEDIKEAARAFTGYRIQQRTKFSYNKNQHDSSSKTVFGKTGKWKGDDIIDLAFEKPTARTYFIQELCKFYLTDGDLPDQAYIEELGDLWAANNFNLLYLIETFFQSRLFFHPAYRGNLIKSPYQFYLGLCQDLQIDVNPFVGRTFQSLRTMGQNFYNPPNVRGWLYGLNWINSTTISGRRQLVDYIFTPINENKLNGNDRRSLRAAQKKGQANFQVDSQRLAKLLKLETDALANHLTTFFITTPSKENYNATIKQLVNDAKSYEKPFQVLRKTVIGILQSPAYNLC